MRAALLLVTSKRGLAGGFNTNLNKEAKRRIEMLEAQGYGVDLHIVGRKGIGFFKYLGRKLETARIDIGDRPTVEHARELVESLIEGFGSGRLASVDLVYAKFVSTIPTPPTTLRRLPVEAASASQTGIRPECSRKPGPAGSPDKPLPPWARGAAYRGLVETAAAEHGARRTAMKNATDNAGEILELLKRTYNRQRQAQITQEIAEIVGGASALQG